MAHLWGGDQLVQNDPRFFIGATEKERPATELRHSRAGTPCLLPNFVQLGGKNVFTSFVKQNKKTKNM